MKKLFYFLAIAAAVAVSCTKEATTPNEDVVENVGKVTLFATLPEFVDATKAGVAPDGVFSWAVGDVIDVRYEKSGAEDLYYEFSCTKDDGEFTYDGTIADGYQLGSVAYYPHEYRGAAANQSFGSIDDAAKGFQMSATISNGVISFVHDNALMKVTVNNVPSFAKQLVVGSAKVNLSLSSAADELIVYVPVAPASAAKLKVEVLDGTGSGANAIISKTTQNSVAIDAAAIYPLPSLTIGTVFVFNDDGKVDQAKFFKTNGTTIDYTKGSVINLNALEDGTKWCILPTSNDWSKKGQPVCLQVFKDGNFVSSTDAVWLYRNFSFDTTESSLKTDYRVYVYMSDSQWSYWGTTVVKFTTWGDISTPVTNAIMERNVDDNGYIVYHELSATNYGKTVKYRFYNENNAGWESKNEDGVVLNRDIWGANL